MQLDNSMISAYAKCQYYYGLRYERHLATRDARPALSVGIAAHEFFRRYLCSEDTTEFIRETLEALSATEDTTASGKFASACAALCAEYPTGVDANGLALIYGKDARNAPYLRWILRYAEIPFEFPLAALGSTGEARHTYMGRIDCIVEDGNGQLWILDLKTSGFANQSHWREACRLSTQMRGYCYAASIHLSKPIAGAIIIPVLTTSRSERGVRYGTAAFAGPEIELRYTEADLELWHSETIAMADDIAASRLLPTGKYCSNCSSIAYGRCDFFTHCLTGYNEQMLQQSCSENIWSPLA